MEKEKFKKVAPGEVEMERKDERPCLGCGKRIPRDGFVRCEACREKPDGHTRIDHPVLAEFLS